MARRYNASTTGLGPTSRRYNGPLPLPLPLPPAMSLPFSPPLSTTWMDPSPYCDKANDTFKPESFPEASVFTIPEVYLSDMDSDFSRHNYSSNSHSEGYCNRPARALSTISSDTRTTSSGGSLLSPVQTDGSDTLTARSGGSPGPSPLRYADADATVKAPKLLVCLGPQCEQSFTSEDDLESHVKSVHTHTCNWAGCHHPSFASRDGLTWHVKAEHLLVCPLPGCPEPSFQSTRLLKTHVSVVHPEVDKDGVKDWQLSPVVGRQKPFPMEQHESTQTTAEHTLKPAERPRKEDTVPEEIFSVAVVKQKCQDQLRGVVEKKAKKNASKSISSLFLTEHDARDLGIPVHPYWQPTHRLDMRLTIKGTPRSADSPTDLVRSRASRLVDTASFPLIFEHAIMPFLSQFLPKWAGLRHVISVTRGKTPQSKRICIMTKLSISRARKIIIAGHVQDLLPENIRPHVTFVFSRGKVGRITWARGLSQNHLDDICAPRNPYFFRSPCMGDSIGIHGNESFQESTATLGPCLVVGGGNYWLGNFHPFFDGYQHLETVQVEHPSPQDRAPCVDQGHDAMAHEDNFQLGDIKVTSGLNLKTTRISHDPYWEECDKEQPLIVTDWALIGARASHANMLRRFPCETQPPLRESLVNATTSIVPGAFVISSGRTSGHQRGQICEIPAYVSGEENGTHKATREWFIEEPYPCDDEEGWIRGGIGVEGDSGAAIVDANTNALIGQLWGRNRYWGPGPRLTFFTPIADIFDDIQEKCGQQTRPQLPQHRDSADRYPMYPSCRQCYDLRTYLDSRRSSRVSLQSMIMGRGDADQDLTSIEAVSELATPRESHRCMEIEEAGASFSSILSPAQLPNFCPGTPAIADMKSPYAATLEVEDLYDAGLVEPEASRKRRAWFTGNPFADGSKRQRTSG
ncbi:hypothetical protein G7046_g6483 [Stylonectria norvegica]|nr:hypothetical protein G7046_g6483 [Stylonectria norvegica]